MILKCKFVIFANKNLKINKLKIRTIVFIQWNIQVLHIVYVIESIVYLENGFNYDYHFIIKDSAEEFEK